MSETPKSRPFEEMEEGMLAGLWTRPSEGFEWRTDLVPAALGQSRHERGPWLVMKGEAGSRYPVLKRVALLEDFVSLARSPEQDKVRVFADKYGPLGRGQWLAPPQGGTVVPGESLALWLGAAHDMAVLWRLWQFVELGRPASLAPFVHWQQHPRRVLVSVVASRGEPNVELSRLLGSDHSSLRKLPTPSSATDSTLADQDMDGDELLKRWEFGDPVEPMRYYIHKVINRELRGHVNMTVLPFRNGAIRYFPDSLLSAIYVRFTLRLAGGNAGERECANPRCYQQRFIPDRRDQRYCSKNCRDLAAYHRKKV